MHECPRDPNYKTNQDFRDEEARLLNIENITTNIKKTFADTQITTTVMLKKCPKIEKILKQEDNFDKIGLPKELYDKIKKRQNNVAF